MLKAQVTFERWENQFALILIDSNKEGRIPMALYEDIQRHLDIHFSGAFMTTPEAEEAMATRAQKILDSLYDTKRLLLFEGHWRYLSVDPLDKTPAGDSL